MARVQEAAPEPHTHQTYGGYYCYSTKAIVSKAVGTNMEALGHRIN